MALTKRERSIAAKFRRYEKSKEQAKKYYDRSNRLLVEIAKSILPKTFTRLSEDGKQLHLKRATADENGILGWGHAAVREFELKVENP